MCFLEASRGVFSGLLKKGGFEGMVTTKGPGGNPMIAVKVLDLKCSYQAHLWRTAQKVLS